MSQGLKNKQIGSEFSVSGWQLYFEFMGGHEMAHIA